MLSFKRVEYPEGSADEIKATRNKLLAESDWTQLPDVSGKVSVLWQTYRQLLRDIPGQPEFPAVVFWPSKPE
jgi:hypothetical protein